MSTNPDDMEDRIRALEDKMEEGENDPSLANSTFADLSGCGILLFLGGIGAAFVIWAMGH